MIANDPAATVIVAVIVAVATAILATPVAELIKNYINRNRVRNDKRLEIQLDTLEKIALKAREVMSKCSTSYSGWQQQHADRLHHIREAVASVAELRNDVWERKRYFIDDPDYYDRLEAIENRTLLIFNDFGISTKLMPNSNEEQIRADFQKKLSELELDLSVFMRASEDKHRKMLGIQDRRRQN